jgi:hypothetical protein
VIEINLLPHEYRKTESTPIARFIAIIAGAVLVTSGLVAYGFVHYSKLKGVREVREATEATYANKKAQADVSLSLQTEITNYEARRKAITQVARKRILQSRKLDEFLDLIHNRGDRSTYFVWLKNLVIRPARAVRRGKPTSGGSMAFAGFSESVEFSRITNLRDAIKKDSFFQDYKTISPPNFKAVEWDDELEPKKAGKFSFDLSFKPLGWRHSSKSGKK